jgi:hypothetical protein
MSANSGTFWRFKAPNPGLIGPGGIRCPNRSEVATSSRVGQVTAKREDPSLVS